MKLHIYGTDASMVFKHDNAASSVFIHDTPALPVLKCGIAVSSVAISQYFYQ